MSVYCVPMRSYQQLIKKLELDIPRSLPIIGSLVNCLQGRLTANFYVDKWPEFSAVVCEYIWPRRSDVADIGAYATSSEALLSVLTEGNLVTWGRRQEFQRIEDVHADFLLAHLKQPGVASVETGLECIHERQVLCYYEPAIKFYGKDSIKQGILQYTAEALQDGLVYGPLKPHHAETVASKWPRLHGWPNKIAYFKELIESYHSSTVFSVDNPDVPVAFVIQFPCNQIFTHTDKKYRGRYLSWIISALILHAISMQNKHFYPSLAEASYELVSAHVRMGAVREGFSVKDLVTKFVPLDSKL